MLNEKQIRDLVQGYGTTVNDGRSVEQLIAGGCLPELNGLTFLNGKVSDSVFGESFVTKDGVPIRLMFRNSRISTHDVVRGSVPFKDQAVASVHEMMLQLSKSAIGTSQFEVPELQASSCVIASENLQLIMVEFVIRKYLAKSGTTTSMWMHWQKALEEKKEFLNYAGHTFNMSDLSANCEFPNPIDTPSTKEKVDRTVTPDYLYEQNICTKEQYAVIKSKAMKGFAIIANHVKGLGMILVDTKTESGINSKREIVSGDELYTMDSSRYWQLNPDKSIMLDKKGNPVSFSKQFARDMVHAEATQMFTKEQLDEIAVRYINACQLITGKEFVPDLRPREKRIISSVKQIIKHLC